MSSLEDEMSYKKYSCCKWCAMIWAKVNEEKWLSGWRPSGKNFEIYLETIQNSNPDVPVTSLYFDKITEQ